MSDNLINKPSVDEAGCVTLPPLQVPLSDQVSWDARTYMLRMFTYFESQFGTDAKQRTRREVEQALHAGVGMLSTDDSALLIKQANVDLQKLELEDIAIDIVVPLKPQSENMQRALIHFCGGIDIFGNEQLRIAVKMAAMMGVKVFVPRFSTQSKNTIQTFKQALGRFYQAVLSNNEIKSIGVLAESSGSLEAVQLIDVIAEQRMQMPDALALVGIQGTASDSNIVSSYLDPSTVRLKLQAAIESTNSQQQGCITGRNATAKKTESILENPSVAHPKAFPATMLISGTRDALLGSTTNFHRKLITAGVDAQLNIFAGMPHSHHAIEHLPETLETFQDLTGFFDAKLRLRSTMANRQ